MKYNLTYSSPSKRTVNNFRNIKQSNQVPKEITYLSYQQQLQKYRMYSKSKSQPVQQQINTINNSPDEFTQQERENLKNAFRYICRLAFKQCDAHSSCLSKLIRKHKNNYCDATLLDNHTKMMKNDAETISGQRYFKQYLSALAIQDQLIVLDYIIWFLKHKYLRYIKKSQTQKGKRKSMKKQLYLRFKNEVMLPYMVNLREQRLNHNN